MIDPAALGTLVLGLEANRHDDEVAAIATGRALRARRRRGSPRVRLAVALRRMAERLEPSTTMSSMNAAARTPGRST